MLLLKGEAQNLLNLINLLCNLGIIPDGNLSRHCTENPLECPNIPGSNCHSLKLRAIWRMKCQLQECHARKLVDGNSKLPLCGSETYTHTPRVIFFSKALSSPVSPIPNVHVSSFQIHSLTEKYQYYYSFQSLLSSSLEKQKQNQKHILTIEHLLCLGHCDKELHKDSIF